MIYVLVWFAGAVLAWAIVHGGNRKPSPTARVFYPDPVTTSESSGGGDNQEWDGAEPTGPDPRP